MILLIRRSLVDESIPICVVLRTPYHDESQLKYSLDRLEITVEAQAFGYASANSASQDAHQERSLSQSRNVIWSDMVDMSQEPVIVIQQEDDHVADRHVFVVWRVQAFLSELDTPLPWLDIVDPYLGRPRTRIQSPMITFKPVARLRSHNTTNHDVLVDPYLPDCIPQTINLLGSLKGDPVLHGAEPLLPAFRLSRNTPTAVSLTSTYKTVAVAAQRLFRAIPAISARVRYTRSKGDNGQPTIIASLDIETAPFFDNDVTITMVDVIVSEGSAEDLAGSHALILPIICRPRDNQVFLFRLTPNGNIADGSNSNPRTLDVKIDATVLVSDVCRPRIEMRWKAGVDFSTALNPSYGTPNQPMQRPKRPASLPVPPTSANDTSTPAAPPPAGSQLGADVSSNQSRSNSVNDLSITITFTAPRDVQVGVPFSWEVFVVNRSSMPRKLAIMVIPKRKKTEIRGHLSKPSSSSAGALREMGNTDAVLDETHLYAMQRNNGNDAVQIVSLSTDVKLGYVTLQLICPHDTYGL